MITAQYLRERLHYDPSTGEFVWLEHAAKPRKWNTKWAGKRAGYTMPNGYRVICVDNARYYAHRLAWLMTYGVISDGLQIDHRNRSRADNRIENLRLATASFNSAHCRGKSKLGRPKGVSLHKQSGLFTAKIRANGARHALGYFKTAEEAGAAYAAAYQRFHGTPLQE